MAGPIYGLDVRAPNRRVEADQPTPRDRERMAAATIAETEAWEMLKAWLTERMNPEHYNKAQDWDAVNRLRGMQEMAKATINKIDGAAAAMKAREKDEATG
jgi:hypothetical protein